MSAAVRDLLGVPAVSVALLGLSERTLTALRLTPRAGLVSARDLAAADARCQGVMAVLGTPPDPEQHNTPDGASGVS